MGFLSPPKPPSAKSQAKAQMAVNRDTARIQSAYMRPDQYDPFGGTETWRERGKDAYGNPLFKKEVTLGETGQQYASGLAGLGNAYFNQAQNFLNNPADFTSGGAFDRAYDYASANIEPRFERTRAAAENRLRNQGLDPTSEAYKSQMNDLALQQNEARNNLVTNLQGQMFNQGIQGRQAQVGEMAGLTQPGLAFGNQVLNPGVGPVQAISTGITPNMPQAMQNNYNQQMANHQGMLGGIGSLAGIGLKGWFGGFS